jgi:type IV secretory pathway VirB2 component (pilin)
VTDLERQLALLRDEIAWPPTPDLAGAVAARIAAEPDPAAHDGRRPWAAVAPRVREWLAGPRARAAAIAALVLVAVVAGTLAAAPGVRARIADWLGIGAVRIERVDRLPDASPSAGLGLGTRTPLGAARRSAGVPVPTITALGPPDAVYVDRRVPGGGSASVVYLARPGLPSATRRIGALLTMLPGGDPLIVKKLLGAGTSVQGVDVDGGFGVFVSGDAHLVIPPNRLAGNILLWVRGDTTYRLETALGRDAALRLARSVR